eukprot:TRINITY_DN27158_c0_g1_i1.p1 TRINITY_DN27158_c0_g1~~TRINITY_DN27158_c0_g1_i1.p1  ORF type:complete len:481 (-),score=68.93 TRINITY_DN27158_c0_g1_i1:59-1501(-)
MAEEIFFAPPASVSASTATRRGYTSVPNFKFYPVGHSDRVQEVSGAQAEEPEETLEEARLSQSQPWPQLANLLACSTRETSEANAATPQLLQEHIQCMDEHVTDADSHITDAMARSRGTNVARESDVAGLGTHSVSESRAKGRLGEAGGQGAPAEGIDFIVERAEASETVEVPGSSGRMGSRTADIDHEGAVEQNFPEFAPPRGAQRAEKVDWDVPQHVVNQLAQAYDEDPQKVGHHQQHSRYSWSGVMDAARAAWIGGTRLLNYGELLPSGTSKALAVMAPGISFESPNMPSQNKLALELGMGRGRAAAHLYFMGMTVVGVELAHERFCIARQALERLAHRCPHTYEMVYLKSQEARIRRCAGPQPAIYEVRHGNFFDQVTSEEVHAAALIFLQVDLPKSVWSPLRNFLGQCRSGCRILSYLDLKLVWQGCGEFAFRDIGSPLLACSWAPERGYRFHCYERLDLEEEQQLLAGLGVGAG